MLPSNSLPLGRSASTPPSPWHRFEPPVYRALQVQSAPLPTTSFTPPAKSVTIPATIPRLLFPLRSFALATRAKFVNGDACEILSNLKSNLLRCGCEVDDDDPAQLSCTIRCAKGATAKFAVTVYDCADQVPAPPGRYLVDLQRVAGCAFLFDRVVAAAFPAGKTCSSQRQFDCLPLPAELVPAAQQEADLTPLLALLARDEFKESAFKAISNLCESDASVKAACRRKRALGDILRAHCDEWCVKRLVSVLQN